MRKFYPNFDREDALDTVLEVPVPEQMFTSTNHNPWRTIKSWLIRPNLYKPSSVFARATEIHFLLGPPSVALPISPLHTLAIKSHPTESSMAKYIVQQYIAAAGGEHALNSIESLCAIGKVKMESTEIVAGNDSKMKSLKHGELGGFVLWQKKPYLWSLELMVSGFKICAGNDGKVAWRQTPWHSSRGPPRPLHRSLQGLDPRFTADLFSSSICTGEKAVNGEDCFVLKLEAEPSKLKESGSRVEILKHTVWGSFSQRSGLLVQLQDSYLLRMKSPGNDVLWEATVESLMQDYRAVDGVSIAHGGRTTVSLLRFGEDNQTRTKTEEEWSVEEVDFNVKGLSGDCFLPPAGLKMAEEGCGIVRDGDGIKREQLRYKLLGNSTRICAVKGGTKVVAVDDENLGTDGVL